MFQRRSREERLTKPVSRARRPLTSVLVLAAILLLAIIVISNEDSDGQSMLQVSGERMPSSIKQI